jgi:heme/copper-type cytochrome/quinol oxidase subunit 4
MSHPADEFKHMANDSPRSGSSKRVMSFVWCGIVVVIVVLGVYFVMAA